MFALQREDGLYLAANGPTEFTRYLTRVWYFVHEQDAQSMKTPSLKVVNVKMTKTMERKVFE